MNTAMLNGSTWGYPKSSKAVNHDLVLKPIVACEYHMFRTPPKSIVSHGKWTIIRHNEVP